MWLYGLLVIPLVGLLICGFVSTSIRSWVNVSVTGINLLLFIGWLLSTHGSGWYFAPEWLRFDPFSALITGITVLVGFTASLYSIHYLELEEKHAVHSREHHENEYHLLFLIFYFTLLGVPLWNNIFVTWVFIEATALASVFLVDYHRDRHSSEASWKYLILMEIGGILALFGTIFLVGGEPAGIHATTWSGLIAAAPHMAPFRLRIGFVLVLAGYGTKAGLVPFNAWLPDAHSQAPSPTSAMLSAIKLNVAMYGIIMTMNILTADHEAYYAHTLLIILGVLTVLVSTVMTVSQRDFKRLFAYSSSENMGMIAIGFALGPIGVFGAYLQMINHSLIKSLLFYESGDLMAAAGSTQIRKLRGFAREYPWAGGILILGFLAIAGAPPFGLFISEFSIIYALVHAKITWLAVIILILLAILFANFLIYALQIGFGQPSEAVRLFHRTHKTFEWKAMLPFGLHIVLTLALGVILPLFLPLVQ